jgi:hypothetical protein
MTRNENMPIEEWAKELELLGKKLQTAGREIAKLTEDPFLRRAKLRQLGEIIAQLSFDKLRAPEVISTYLDEQCQMEAAEFWKRFSDAVTAEGWHLFGSTNRRLIARGIFVELKEDSVVVESSVKTLTPHVPSLIALLRPMVSELVAKEEDLVKFVDLLKRTWDMTGGRGEISLENVYRIVFVLLQSKTFWDKMTTTKIQLLSRPAFRVRLSAALERGIGTHDGYSFRLGTALNQKEIWEIFSPGEGRVVQVGRISFERSEK